MLQENPGLGVGVRRRGPFGIFDFGFRIASHLLPATFEEMAPITLSYHVGVSVYTFVHQDAGKLRIINCAKSLYMTPQMNADECRQYQVFMRLCFLNMRNYL